MNNDKKELLVTDFCNFVCELYKYMEEASANNTGITIDICAKDVKKWAEEHISYIEIY